MPTYLALVTVLADVDADALAGMADALGARQTSTEGGRVRLWVPGEAPDLPTAVHAAHQHAAEVLDGVPHEVEVEESPAP